MTRGQKQEVIFPGQRFCSTWWNHQLFRFFRASIWLVCVLRLFFPSVDTYLIPLTCSYTGWSIVIGNVLLTVGFIATSYIHAWLGKAWRSGIDPEAPVVLIWHGLYRYSRNPMFVGVAIAQVGFLLALPSVFSLLCLLFGLVTLYRQALSEEQHLRQVLPEQYQTYCASVRRWL